jgi:hypothetical protein
LLLKEGVIDSLWGPTFPPVQQQPGGGSMDWGLAEKNHL